ncbi:hypothetical protein [Brevundimonas sp.]|uniref:hypothetical protein n=1 Tax=Brevundimonas sp. TaxID=1871086 RepID=UPI0022C3EA49|nr:hypothetical protein [Brevundimonas sp.]MCZ8193898.1 hypothetical protein [Brevundimonas sp.]
MNRLLRALAAASVVVALAGCGTILGAQNALKSEPREPYRSANLAIAEANRNAVVGLGNALFNMNLPECTGFMTDNAPNNPNATANCAPAQSRGVNSRQLDIYLDRSVFIIDAYCDAYLAALADLGDSNRWTRTQFNIVANYAGVLMALAGQSADSIGYLNAATGFFNSSADNLETLVLISAAPSKLTPLVEGAKTSLRDDLPALRQGDVDLRWSSYSRWLQTYAGQCTPRGIRLLIDDAIDTTSAAATPVRLASSAAQLGPLLQAPLFGMVKEDSLRSGWPDLTRVENLGPLVWLIRSWGSLSEEDSAFIQGRLGSSLTDAARAALSDEANLRRLQMLTMGPNQAQFDELVRTARNEFATVSRAEAERQRASEAIERAEAAEASLASLNQELADLRRQLDERAPATPQPASAPAESSTDEAGGGSDS